MKAAIRAVFTCYRPTCNNMTMQDHSVCASVTWYKLYVPSKCMLQNVTRYTMLHSAQCYTLHSVTRCTMLLVTRCYVLHNVTCCTMLLVAQCYMLHNVTCCTMLHVTQCYILPVLRSQRLTGINPTITYSTASVILHKSRTRKVKGFESI